MSERKLASVQTVLSVDPIEGADSIEKIKILGWTLVAKKGEFAPGDKCIYFEVDAILPDLPVFEFMRSKKFRLKAARLRGVVSMGLALPLSAFPEIESRNPEVGEDLTAEIGVEKYDAEAQQFKSGGSFNAGNAKGDFPFFIRKTDETRIQSIPGILEEMAGQLCYTTVKCDGTSATFYLKDGEFGVCSRNMEIMRPVPDEIETVTESSDIWGIWPRFSKINKLRTDAGHEEIAIEEFVAKEKRQRRSIYWTVAKKSGVEEKMREMGKNLALQGEICGPGIQKNRMELPEISLFIFSAYDIDSQQYISAENLFEICQQLGLKTVPIINTNKVFPILKTVDDLIEDARGVYDRTSNNREGIVIRPMIEKMSVWTPDNRMSFKVINEDYLLSTGQ